MTDFFWFWKKAIAKSVGTPRLVAKCAAPSDMEQRILMCLDIQPISFNMLRDRAEPDRTTRLQYVYALNRLLKSGKAIAHKNEIRLAAPLVSNQEHRQR